MTDILAARTTSGFPLSIGTGMALESLFTPIADVYDKDRDPPDKIPLADYQQYWFNLTTLFRNMSQSVSAEQSHQLVEQDFVSHLNVEIEVIRSLFKQSAPNAEVVFFYNDYRKVFISPRYAKVQVRTDNSDIKRAYTRTLVKTMETMVKVDSSIMECHGPLTPKHKSQTLLLTHQPFDLLSAYRFGLQANMMHLLESHTAKLKKRHDWGSKYYPLPSGGTQTLPFYSMLLFIFGDRTLIQPAPIELRKTIMSAATNRKWTPFTTLDKIKFDISNDVKEPFVKDFVLSLPTV